MRLNIRLRSDYDLPDRPRLATRPMPSNIKPLASSTNVAGSGILPALVTVICPFEMLKPWSEKFRKTFENIRVDTPAVSALNSITAISPLPLNAEPKADTPKIWPSVLSTIPGLVKNQSAGRKAPAVAPATSAAKISGLNVRSN